MQNYFDNEIKNIERELVRLKTSQQKFAGQVPLVTKSVQVAIPLTLNQARTTARGEKLYKLIVDKPMLFVATLAKYYDDVTKSEDYPRTTRMIYHFVSKISASQYLIEIVAYGTQIGAGNDVTTLMNGGSITLNNTLTVTATDEFRLEAM